MSTNSVEYAKIAALDADQALLTTQDLGGRLRVAFFSKTAASETSGSTINLTKLPGNSRVLAILWASDDLGAGSASIEIGDSGDTNRLVAAFDVASAAIAYGLLALRTPTTITPDIGFGYTYTDATVITATTSVGDLNTGKFWGAVIYVKD